MWGESAQACYSRDEMQQTQPSLNVASPLLRIGAFLLDTVIASLLSLTILTILGDGDSLSDPNKLEQGTIAVVIVANAVYTIAFNAAMSATPGKIALRMYIADQKGARIRPDTAILRYIVFLVGHTFFFGTLISLFLVLTPTRRTIHDRIAGTSVLRRQQGVEAPPPDLS